MSSPQTHAPATAIPSDVEDLLAFRVARKALKLVSAIVVPFLAVLGFFVYDAVARVNEAASHREHVRDSLVASAAETQRHISEADADAVPLIEEALSWVS